MEKSKVFNKILLSSLAFGVSFGIGMLFGDGNIKKALAVGGIGGVSVFAGTVVTDKEPNTSSEKDNSIDELQKKQELKSVNDNLSATTEDVSQPKEQEKSIESSNIVEETPEISISLGEDESPQLETDLNESEEIVEEEPISKIKSPFESLDDIVEADPFSESESPVESLEEMPEMSMEEPISELESPEVDPFAESEPPAESLEEIPEAIVEEPFFELGAPAESLEEMPEAIAEEP
ncbi:MAG: hypothetical protein AAGA80_20015, partial [Cyanobacteria bacterium P01_F01_bin.143]